jgi:hypothetical protein
MKAFTVLNGYSWRIPRDDLKCIKTISSMITKDVVLQQTCPQRMWKR